MERFTNDCIQMVKNSKAEEDKMLGIRKHEVSAQEIQQSLKISLQRLRNCIEFTLLMRRRVARLTLELAKSTSNYDQQSGEAILVAELDKCNTHAATLPLEAILADINKKLQKQDHS